MSYNFLKWIIKSRKAPLPYLLKRKILIDYINKYNLVYFVETGTCFGDMLNGVKDSVKKSYSIEIDKTLYKCAIQRFKNDKSVSCKHGDSAIELEEIIKNVDKPTLFYLDAHYSGQGTGRGESDTPLLRELELLLNLEFENHVILIDDARHLGLGDYPHLSKISDLVKKISNLNIYNKDDIIRIMSKKI